MPVIDEFFHPFNLAFVFGHGFVIHASLEKMFLTVVNLCTMLQLKSTKGSKWPQQDLLNTVILLKDGEGDSSTFKCGETHV